MKNQIIKTILIGTLITLNVNACKWFLPMSKEDALKKLEEPMSNQKNPLVLMKTSLGDMLIEIYTDKAPNTAKNFIGLATGTQEFMDPKKNETTKKPYFDGLIFHRVIPNFMIQGGDILGNGTGGPGYQFEDEISAVALGLDKLKVKDLPYYANDVQLLINSELNITSMADLNSKKSKIDALQKQYNEMSVENLLQKRGYSFKNELQSAPNVTYTLAMANSGPNTNGSQFFINLVDNKHLYGKHTVFGKVLHGRNVPEKIASISKDERNKPLEDIKIKSIKVLE